MKDLELFSSVFVRWLSLKIAETSNIWKREQPVSDFLAE